MKTGVLHGVVAGLSLAALSGQVAAADAIGVPAVGGQPEYLFLEKVPREQGRATAEMIAQAKKK